MCLDLFHTLVQLTYNMQLFVAALKVATAWNQHSSSPNKLRPSVLIENTQTSDAFMNLNNCARNTDSMNITEEININHSPLFSQAVALAKTIVFLSENNKNMIGTSNYPTDDKDDDFLMDHDSSNADNVPLLSKDNEENLLMLESYGRQCTLPFLRFATLLKKYTYEENIDDRQFKIKSSLDNKKHLPMKNDTKNILTENLFPGTLKHCHQSLSKNDHEFLILARYLKLFKIDEGSQVCEYCDNKNNQNCNISDSKKYLSYLLPSAMECVRWPYSATDNVSTSIPCTWLTSFREALVTKSSKSVVILENANSIVASASPDINPNCKSVNAIITMAARQLLSVDCCKGSGIFNHSLLPTVDWRGPRLLKLPYAYDDVFQFYHGRKCYRCHCIPRESSVCLFCGTVVCLKENCCRTNDIFEAVQVNIIQIFMLIIYF